jgi:hypothetical protein
VSPSERLADFLGVSSSGLGSRALLAGSLGSAAEGGSTRGSCACLLSDLLGMDLEEDFGVRDEEAGAVSVSAACCC